MNRKQLISLWCGIAVVVLYGILSIVRSRQLLNPYDVLYYLVPWVFIVILVTGVLIYFFKGNRAVANKSDIIKWLMQFSFSSLFLILAEKFFVKGGSMGTIVGRILLSCPLASALGVILGDLSLYKGKKLIIPAALVALGAALIGVFVGLFFVDLVKPFYILPYVGRFIAYAFCLAATTAPPIICYNAVTKSERKYLAKVKEDEKKKQEESKANK